MLYKLHKPFCDTVILNLVGGQALPEKKQALRKKNPPPKEICLQRSRLHFYLTLVHKSGSELFLLVLCGKLKTLMKEKWQGYQKTFCLVDLALISAVANSWTGSPLNDFS